MLIKEYRICLPMTVEEYRIAQLYMIQKKSRVESSGKESGVEILINEPYNNGPGGDGQYTHKLYHIGSHLPSWFRSMVPKSALEVEEEAWNAYPYTKTIYRTPFIEKFLLEIETVYHNDPGCQDNVFKLSKADLDNRVVDHLDIVKDSISPGDYSIEEDPTRYISLKTGRGPLTKEWREEYAKEMVKDSNNNDGINSSINNGAYNYENSSSKKKEIMCAYKLCRVEFKYWGMQTKTEKYIHDIALRKTMLRAHRQAWCWQDEYFGLTIEDIRKLEYETQQKLKEKMTGPAIDETDSTTLHPQTLTDTDGVLRLLEAKPASHKKSNLSINSFNDTSHIEKLQHSSSDEEFFDADDGQMPAPSNDEVFSPNMSSSISSTRRQNPISSEDFGNPEVLFILLHGGDVTESCDQGVMAKNSDLYTLRRTCESVIRSKYPSMVGRIFVEMVPCPNLCLDFVHFISLLAPSSETAGGLWEKVPPSSLALFITGSSGYKELLSEVETGVNKCYGRFRKQSFKRNGCEFNGQVCMLADSVGSLFAYDLLSSYTCKTTSTNAGTTNVATTNVATTNVEALRVPTSTSSTESFPFSTSTSPLLKTPQLIKNPSHSFNIQSQRPCYPFNQSHPTAQRYGLSASSDSSPAANRKNQRSNEDILLDDVGPISFEVEDFFIFGSSLPFILAYRVHNGFYKGVPPEPHCHHFYNLFYPTDPHAFRLEPLLDPCFKVVHPSEVIRFNKMADEETDGVYLVEILNNAPDLFNKVTNNLHSSSQDDDDDEEDEDDKTFENFSAIYNNNNNDSKMNEKANEISNNKSSIQIQGFSNQKSLNSTDRSFKKMNRILEKWWGNKRLDYSLYCPDAFQHLPRHSLPPIVHSSFWESHDMVAFVLRQALKQDAVMTSEVATTTSTSLDFNKTTSILSSSIGREKWLRKGTTLKVKAIAANHRANDIVLLEGREQVITAKFVYGLLDVASLSGEKVDIDIKVRGQIERMDTVVTDANGRVVYSLPNDKKLPVGLYSVTASVRVDQTQASLLMAILPVRTEVVVFSIDGSFTASVSIMGRDPRLQPGAVDVVRHWCNAGYLIHYISARPDMQHRKVTKWMAKHNFPRGFMWFADGLSAEPLRQKGAHLRQMVRDTQIVVSAAYGSSKDIAVYQSIGLQPQQIFIVGKAAKKHHSEATILSDGYCNHLSHLNSHFPHAVNQKLSFRAGNFQPFPLPTQPVTQHPIPQAFNQSWRRASTNPIKPLPTLANQDRAKDNQSNDTLSQSFNFPRKFK